jgi:hypothetical protein
MRRQAFFLRTLNVRQLALNQFGQRVARAGGFNLFAFERLSQRDRMHPELVRGFSQRVSVQYLGTHNDKESSGSCRSLKAPNSRYRAITGNTRQCLEEPFRRSSKANTLKIPV